MTAPRPRRRFQIHLSTAVALMLTAAVLLGTNFLRTQRELSRWYPDNHGPTLSIWSESYGWPFPIVYDSFYEFRGDKAAVFDVTGRENVTDQGAFSISEGRHINKELAALKGIDYANAALNLGVYACILLVLAVALESLVRRREARKP